MSNKERNSSRKRSREQRRSKPRNRPASRSGSNDTITSFNPILGFSESEPKRKRLRDEYSEYVRNQIKENEKSKSRSRKHVRIDESNHDIISLSNLKNDYAHKQRYKHSYFKYRDDHSSSSRFRNPEESFSMIKVEDPVHQEKYKDDNESLNRREDSPTGTLISILPHEHESPLQKESKKKALASELKAQIELKKEIKRKEKEAKKNLDYQYLYEYIQSNPFGKMGAGAPLRDHKGHIVAHRLKIMDDAAAKSFHQSFYNQKFDDDASNADDVSERKSKIQNLNETEIGLQFLSWNNQEKKRKEMLQEEWKHELDEQANLLK